MHILKKISELNKPCVLAMGTFDGFHLGHQVVLKRARELAEASGGDLAVLTFANHPLSYLKPGQEPPELMDREQRWEFCADFGVEYLLEIEFDQNFADIAPQDFARQVQQHLVVVGEDFTFGSGGRGDLQLFSQVEICPLLTMNGAVVSSSRIRREIGAGRMEEAQRLLGRAYIIRGMVQEGQKLGRTLGFPTVNLELRKYAVPSYGAYAGLVQYRGAKYPAMINIGIHPTLTIPKPRLEAHLLNFQGDLYGQNLEVEFWHKIRDDCKFDSLEKLKSQLEKDHYNVVKFFQGDF